jgi:hypothetical protein
MIRDCERIRNEIFRHLTIISNWRQTSTSLFFVILTIFIALYAIVTTIVSNAREELYYAIGAGIILLIFYAILKFTRIASSGRYILPNFSSREYIYHEKAIIKYMKELEKCCIELNKNCDKNFVVLCLDLEDLKMITNYEAKARQDNYKEIIS